MIAREDPAQALQLRAGLRARVFAFLLQRVNARYEHWIAARKRALLGELRGTVLEIGPGAGANLRYYAPGVHWIGIEPNVYMRAYLRSEAVSRGMQVDLRAGVAERLEAGNASVDAVVGTLVLCSVTSLAGALKEIRRVLKPGGQFVFIEHIAAPKGTWLRGAQRVLRPCCRFFAEGCHPDRESAEAIEAAGFSEVRLERFRAPLPVVSPHVAGVAIR